MAGPRRSARLRQRTAQQALASARTSGPTTQKEANEPTRSANNSSKRIRKRPNDADETSHAAQSEKISAGSKRSAPEPLASIDPPKKRRLHRSCEAQDDEHQETLKHTKLPSNGGSHNDRTTPRSVNVPEEAQTNALLSLGGDEESLSFLEILISIISTQRLLDEKRAAEHKCLTEKSQLHFLMNFTRPALLNCPPTDEHRAMRDKLHANMQRYKRHLAQREEREELLNKSSEALARSLEKCKDRLDTYLQPSGVLLDLPCLANSIDFQEAFESCQLHHLILADATFAMHQLEQETRVIENSAQEHSRRLAARALDLMKSSTSQQPSSVVEVENDEHPFVRNNETYIGLSEQQLRLEIEIQEAKQVLSNHKDILTKIAEGLLGESGLRFLPIAQEPATQSQQAQQPASPETHAPVPGNPTTAQDEEATRDQLVGEATTEQNEKDTLESELLRAQEQLEKARRDFDRGRRLTGVEAALVPPLLADDTIEDHLGANSALKLSRVTKNLIEAEDRVSELRRTARQAGLLESYPIDQSWDFEDRSDDGYADSMYAEMVEDARPGVEEWLLCLASPADVLPPATHPVPPKSHPDLEPFDLGEDSGESFPEARMKKRIDDYRRECGHLRHTGDFPRFECDKIMPAQPPQRINSHMI